MKVWIYYWDIDYEGCSQVEQAFTTREAAIDYFCRTYSMTEKQFEKQLKNRYSELRLEEISVL